MPNNSVFEGCVITTTGFCGAEHPNITKAMKDLVLAGGGVWADTFEEGTTHLVSRDPMWEYDFETVERRLVQAANANASASANASSNGSNKDKDKDHIFIVYADWLFSSFRHSARQPEEWYSAESMPHPFSSGAVTREPSPLRPPAPKNGLSMSRDASPNGGNGFRGYSQHNSHSPPTTTTGSTATTPDTTHPPMTPAASVPDLAEYLAASLEQGEGIKAALQAILQSEPAHPDKRRIEGDLATRNLLPIMSNLVNQPNGML